MPTLTRTTKAELEIWFQRFCRLLFALAVAPYCFAQQIDTAISSNQERPFTILDQVGDQKEVQAFLTIYEEQDARRKGDLAESFLRNYRQSWLLAPVYEMAAKASM